MKKEKKGKNRSVRLFESHEEEVETHMKKTGANFQSTLDFFLEKLFSIEKYNKNK